MSEKSDLLGQAARFANSLAHCRELHISVVKAEPKGLILQLPYDTRLIGNPETGVIHGGAITTLMDSASASCLVYALDEYEFCPTLDLRVDYMRPAKPGLPVFARAYSHRVTPNIIFTRCLAYQTKKEQGGEKQVRVAHCVATFMRIGKDSMPASFINWIRRGE